MSQSLLNAQVIGLGAAGNKAAINLTKKKYIEIEDVLLINSTAKDIPVEFINSHQNNYAIIGDGIGGCGQEREKGKQVCLEALQSGKLNLDKFIKPTTDFVVVISSTEGGTGSGSSVVVAQYIKEVLNTDVVLFAITGFEQKPIVPRSIANTLDFFKDTKSSYHVEILSNKKFLSECRGNYMKAESMCNDEIAKRFSVITGQRMVTHATQNIDARDLKKLVTEPGWGNTEIATVEERIKNVAQFNDILNNMLDDTKSIDVLKPSLKRLGGIVNLSEKEQGSIDYNFSEVINRYGTPFELYKHIEDCEAEERFIAFIGTGMHMPIEYFENLYDEYQQSVTSVNTSEDDFFSKMSNMQTTSEFDLKETTRTAAEDAKAKNDFFSSFGVSTPPTSNTSSTTEESEIILDGGDSNVKSVRGDFKNY